MSRLLGDAQVIEGCAVTADGTTMTVKVGTGVMAIPTGTGGTRYHYFAGIDTSGGEPVTIGTANASNPRVDTVVAYIDKAVTASDGTANNPNNMLKLISVPGTAAASPTEATDTAITSAVGAGNPWIKLATVKVDTNATQILQTKVTDARKLKVTVDANGWTVYDYGTYKRFTKNFPPSFATAGSIAGDATAGPLGEVSSTALPVGVANRGQLKSFTYSAFSEASPGNPEVLIVSAAGNPYDASATSLPQFFVHNTFPSQATVRNLRITVELTA